MIKVVGSQTIFVAYAQEYDAITGVSFVNDASNVQDA